MKRLIDELGPSARRDLLESVEADEPRHPDARARALADALAVLGVPAGATTDRPAQKAPTNHPPPPPPSVTLATPAVKALTVAALVVGGAVIIAGRAGDDRTTRPPPTPIGIAHSTGSEATPPPVLPSSQVVLATEPSSAASIWEDRARPAAPPRLLSSSSTPSGHMREDALAREVRTIGAARAAMASGNPDLALRELDEYERIPDAQALRPEARVLRLEALAKAGRTKEAAALGDALRSDPMMSTYSRRIDAVLKRVAPKEGAP